MEPSLHILETPEALHRSAAERLVALARQSIAEHGGFHIALSGGETPRGVYRQLAAPPFVDQVEWSRVHIYFGDERCVGPDHPESNFRMSCEALLDHVPLPPGQIHQMPTDLSPEEAARQYAILLEHSLPRRHGEPQFDTVLLGLGGDGHIASLFPNTSALEEMGRSVTAVYAERLKSWRVSLTLPLINAARHLLFLVVGKGKAEVVLRALHPTFGDIALPVRRLAPKGQVEWFLDRDAASRLEAVT